MCNKPHLWQKGIESQNELSVACKELLHPLDDAFRIDPAQCPQAEIWRASLSACQQAVIITLAKLHTQETMSNGLWKLWLRNLPLGFELFHDLQEGIIYILPVCKLDLDVA